MSFIRKIQSRDVPSLTDTFVHQDSDYFETLYLDHLQAQCQTFVAVEKDKEGERHYHGFVSLTYQSTITSFWRRNIPEITDLYYRNRSIGESLIASCESIARDAGYQKIGCCVIQEGDYQTMQSLYEASGYIVDDSGIKGANQLLLVKDLT